MYHSMCIITCVSYICIIHAQNEPRMNPEWPQNDPKMTPRYFFFFLPWFPLRNQRDVRNVLDSLIPFKEPKWCDWIPFFFLDWINLIPLRNQIDSGSRVYGVPLVQVQKTERKTRFNLKNHDSSFPVAAWQTSTDPRHRAEVSCHRRGINRVLCVFFWAPYTLVSARAQHKRGSIIWHPPAIHGGSKLLTLSQVGCLHGTRFYIAGGDGAYRGAGTLSGHVE